MMGKTHVCFGVAITSSFLLPNNIKNKNELIIYILTAIIASLLPDIDCENSIIRNNIRNYKSILILSLFLIFYINNKYISYNFFNYKTLVSLLFLIILFYIAHLNHRDMSHSIFINLFLSFLTFILFDYMVSFIFFINYFSHILLDLLNYKQVKLLKPFSNKGFSLKLCKSNSITNYIIGLCGFSISLFNIYKLLI